MTGPESDYCQRWTGGTHSWRHPSDGGFDARRFMVVPIPKGTATTFVERHHYAGTLSAARLCYGLVTDDDRLATDGTLVDGLHLVGVAALSIPMGRAVLTNVFPDLEPYAESLELGRFVLTDTPANAESWFLGSTDGIFSQAAAAGVRGIVSFADPMPRRRTVIDGHGVERTETITPGHVGLIYQATNGHACGRSTARSLTYLPRHGLVLSDRALQKVRQQESGAGGVERRMVDLGARVRRAGESPRAWLSDALDDLDAVKVRHPGNYRYAWKIGTRAQRRGVHIAPPRTAYPKPAGDVVTMPQGTRQMTLA